MGKLLSNGCSFLTPRNKDGVETFTTKILAEQYDLELVNGTTVTKLIKGRFTNDGEITK